MAADFGRLGFAASLRSAADSMERSVKELEETVAGRVSKVSALLGSFSAKSGGLGQEPSFGTIVASLAAHGAAYCKEKGIDATTEPVVVAAATPYSEPAAPASTRQSAAESSSRKGTASSRRRKRVAADSSKNNPEDVMSPATRRKYNLRTRRNKIKGPKAAQGALDLLGKLEKKLPKKYQLNKDFRNKLALTLQSVTESRAQGAALSEIKKFVDATVMQCNEYLGVLSRLNLVEKKKDKVGAKYYRCSKSSNNNGKASRRR